MKDTDFLSMSSYVRVREKTLLDGAGLDRIADAASTQEALRMISQNSDYDFSALRRPEDYEDVVKAELRRVYEMAYKLAKHYPETVEIIGCKYDYHNVKVALKAKYQGVSGGLPFVEATPVAPKEIAAIVEKYDSKSSLPAHILEAVREGSAAFERTNNPQMIDIALDKRMYGHMLRLAEGFGNQFILGYVRNAIDYYNLKTLVRVKGMQKGTAFLAECLAPGGGTDPGLLMTNYGKNAGALAMAFSFKDYGAVVKAGMESFERTGNYSELERLFDNLQIAYVKNAKRIPFGPEVLFAYLVSKENEVRQIRLVVACKQNQVPVETLKERLRDNYV